MTDSVDRDIAQLEGRHQDDKLFVWFSRSSAAIWRAARSIADFLPHVLKKTKAKNPFLGIAVAFAVLILSFAVAIPTYLLIAPTLQIILLILALLAFAPRILWNLLKNLVNPRERAVPEVRVEESEARVRAAILDMATIGVWVMENEGFTYTVWSRAMLDDNDIKAGLNEFGGGDEQACLERVYCWSRAMLIGVYQYKAGTRGYYQWRERLLEKLDQHTKRDIERYLPELYRLVDEKEGQNAPSRDAEWVLTALVGTALRSKSE